MKRRAVLTAKSWRYLAFFLDVRALVVLSFCYVLLAPFAGITLLPWLDRGLFALGATLQRETVDTRQYVRVDISPDEMQRLLHDPLNAKAAMTMIAQLQETYTRGVALVLREPMWTDYGIMEMLLNRNHFASDSLPAAELAAMLQATRTFQSMLASERFLRVQILQQAQTIKPVESRSWLLGKQQPASLLYRSAAHTLGAVAFPRPPLYPLADGPWLERPLLWYSEQGVRPDARLALFQLQQQFRQPEWYPGSNVIQYPDLQLRISLSATLLPFLSDNASRLPDVQHYRLDQLSGQETRRILHEKTVVIAETGDAAADDLLYSVVALASGLYAVNVPWFALAHIMTVVALLLYCLSIPYWRFKVSAVISLLLLSSMLLIQQLLLLLHREWLPIAQWIAALLAGHLLMALWCVRRSYYPLLNDVASAEAALMPAAAMRPVATGGAAGLFAGWFGKKSSKPSVGKIPPVFGNRHEIDYDDLDETETLQATVPLKAAGGLVAPRAAGMRRQLGRYQVQRELGRGAMGVVYLGFDPKISRQVAIKTLHYEQFSAMELPALKERFFREAEAAGRLRHPNVVTIYDAGEEADLAYIAMDYVSGTSLAAHVRKPELLDIEMVYWIMAQVADAVDYANSQGIVHRDIKPSNILFDSQTNEVKVADFGIARIMDGSATRTKTGDILGSPLYMSPEQLKGEQATARSDIFSIGVTFYQLLSGELPFKGDSLANLSYQIVQGKYRPIEEVCPGLPDSARRIINKALQKNAANRYATAGEMADALQRAYEREFS